MFNMALHYSGLGAVIAVHTFCILIALTPTNCSSLLLLFVAYTCNITMCYYLRSQCLDDCLMYNKMCFLANLYFIFIYVCSILDIVSMYPFRKMDFVIKLQHCIV